MGQKVARVMAQRTAEINSVRRELGRGRGKGELIKVIGLTELIGMVGLGGLDRYQGNLSYMG